MRTAKILLIAGVIFLLSGCKLAVIVVEGGEVQSTSSGTCIASSICIVDVTDLSFSETFTAVPEQGWHFEKWQKGNRFFCGGSSVPVCSLSLEGYEDTEEVQKMVASSETFYLMPIFRMYRDYPDIVTVEGREWLQPYLFSGLSPNEINDVCPEGVCTGMLNGIDLSSWTWASIDEVIELLNAYDLKPPIPTYDEISGVISFKGGHDIFNDFVPTGIGPLDLDSPDSNFIDGFAKGAPSKPDEFLRPLLLVTEEFNSGNLAVTAASPTSGPYLSVGAWFHRPAE